MVRRINGKIIKGIAGFYYVQSEGKGLFACKAKGLFRNMGIKPLVGDNCVIRITDESAKEGNVEEILTRKNEIIRPACANIDEAVIVVSASKPVIKYNLLDKILVFFGFYDIPVCICLNKTDDADEKIILKISHILPCIRHADTRRNNRLLPLFLPSGGNRSCLQTTSRSRSRRTGNSPTRLPFSLPSRV